YLLLAVMVIYCVSLTAYYVWRNGFSDPVQVLGERHSLDEREVWFSSKGNLVEVATNEETVTIMPWVGERPATPIVISLRDVLGRAVTRGNLSPEESNLLLDIPAGYFSRVRKFAIARDLSNFFLEVSGYLVIYDLISNQVKIEPLFEHVTARPGI